jgi:two-component system KDP operon response regulator KdpE
MTGKKILIVDDDKHLVLALGARLKANGYSVVSAGDGISAIAMARTEKPDLVILDLGLPAGDGFSVLERMKGLTETTPTIVLSARDPSGNRSRALAGGAVAYFQKPPNAHELLSEIGRALGETVALSAFLAR